MLRSLARIVTAVVVLAAVGVLALLIIVRQPTFTALPFDGSTRADAHLLRRHVQFLTTRAVPRDASHPENLERCANYIATHFRAAGGDTSLQRYDARGRSYVNVIARFGPANSTAPLLVIGAHYDAFGEHAPLPAADDNASGTAGLLELARLLGKEKIAQPVLLVAFSTEEPPFFGSDLMGSAVHAESLAKSGAHVRGMISLEMSGYFADEQSWPNPLFEAIYPTRGNFIGVAGGWQDRTLARHVKRAIDGAGMPVVSFTGPRETSDASDHRNYWRHGWPAVVITDTAFLRNPQYHTKGDTAVTLDYTKMAHVIDGVFTATK